MHNQYNYRVPVPVRVLSIISTASGAMGLIFCWCYGGFIFASITALVTSCIAKNKSYSNDYGKYTTMTKTGKILGIVGIIANAVTALVFTFLLAFGVAEILTEFNVW